MTWSRVFWLVVALALLAGVAVVVPASPIYLPKLLTLGGQYDGISARQWVKSLDDPDPAVRRKAIFSLGSIGPEAADAAVPRLCQILREDADASARMQAAEALGKMGPAAKAAVPDLTQALSDGDGFVRMSAIGALRGLRAEARPAVPALIAALKDEKNDTNMQAFMQTIQEAAAVALGFISAGTDEAVPALREALKGKPRPEMRSAVARALGEIGPPAKAAEPELQALLKDSVEDVRLNAEEAVELVNGRVPVQKRR